MMSEHSSVPPRPVRVARPAEAAVKPYYPHTKLVKSNLLELGTALDEARQELERVRAETAHLREAAAADVESVRQKAHQEGSIQATAEFLGLLEHGAQEIERLRERMGHDVQELAFKFARMILNTEFDLRPEKMAELVNSVLERVKLFNQVTIVLHPADLDKVREYGTEFLKRLPFANMVNFRSDPKLSLHGVRIETEMGAFDGSLDTQIGRLRESILKERKAGLNKVSS